MTPQEARAELRAIEKQMGSRARISVFLSSGETKAALWASIQPNGYGSGREAEFRAEADDFAALVTDIRAAWAKHQADYETEQVRKLSLAIIRVTYDQGECTDAAVRADGFTDQDLERYGAAAIERANAMAERGPFSIKRLARSNGAPAEAAA